MRPILWLGKIWDKQILGKTTEINLTETKVLIVLLETITLMNHKQHIMQMHLEVHSMYHICGNL